MKWIKIEELLPPYGSEETFLITDGENISTGYYEYEFCHDEENDPFLYRKPKWIADNSQLATCESGYALVTHWMPLPLLPDEEEDD